MVREKSPENNWREPIELEGTVHQHGDRSTYVCHGCRCDECTDANTAYGYELYWRYKTKKHLSEFQEILEMVKEGQKRSRLG